eukprot:10670033-Heterocapsa_arctica.AAC.1
MNTVLDAEEVSKPNILKQPSMCSGEGNYAPRSSDLDNIMTNNTKLDSMDGGTVLHVKLKGQR